MALYWIGAIYDRPGDQPESAAIYDSPYVDRVRISAHKCSLGASSRTSKPTEPSCVALEIDPKKRAAAKKEKGSQMTIEERVERLEASWGKTDPLVRELRDAVTVTAELENRQGKLVKEQSYRIAEHEDWLREHKASIKRHDAAMELLDKRIAELVSGIGAFIAAQGKK